MLYERQFMLPVNAKQCCTSALCQAAHSIKSLTHIAIKEGHTKHYDDKVLESSDTLKLYDDELFETVSNSLVFKHG